MLRLSTTMWLEVEAIKEREERESKGRKTQESTFKPSWGDSLRETIDNPTYVRRTSPRIPMRRKLNCLSSSWLISSHIAFIKEKRESKDPTNPRTKHPFPPNQLSTLHRFSKALGSSMFSILSLSERILYPACVIEFEEVD